MQDLPLISVIITLYNKEKYIKEAICSIPRYDFLELILVDDGSTDCSLKIAQDELIKFKYYTIITQPNRGLGIARNEGLRKSTGQYICFLDADDKYSSGFFDILQNIIKSYNIDMIYTRFIGFNGNIIREYKTSKIISTHSGFTSVKKNPYLVRAMSACNKCIKRSLIVNNEIYFAPKTYYEDIIFTAACLENAENIFVTDEVFYYYRNNVNNSIVAVITKKHVVDLINQHKKAIYSIQSALLKNLLTIKFILTLVNLSKNTHHYDRLILHEIYKILSITSFLRNSFYLISFIEMYSIVSFIVCGFFNKIISGCMKKIYQLK